MTILTPATSGNTDTPYSKLAFNEEDPVPQGTAVTVVTLTPVSAKRIKVIAVSGDFPALWEIFIDSTLDDKFVVPFRADRIFVNIPLAAGSTLDVKVTHQYSVLDAKFNGTIYGF